MFKTIVIAALGFAAVSAQFLEYRNLQDAAPVAFAAACAVSATGVESGCNTAGFCCAANTRTAVPTAAPLCVPTDFIGQNITIGATTFSFSKCLANVTATAPVRTACAANDACALGQCCTDVALTAGLTTANGTATRKFCTAGAA